MYYEDAGKAISTKLDEVTAALNAKLQSINRTWKTTIHPYNIYHIRKGHISDVAVDGSVLRAPLVFVNVISAPFSCCACVRPCCVEDFSVYLTSLSMYYHSPYSNTGGLMTVSLPV